MFAVQFYPNGEKENQLHSKTQISIEYFPKRVMLTSIGLAGAGVGVGIGVGVGNFAIFTGLSVFIRFSNTEGTDGGMRK